MTISNIVAEEGNRNFCYCFKSYSLPDIPTH